MNNDIRIARIRELYESYECELKELAEEYDRKYDSARTPDDIMEVLDWYETSKKLLREQWVMDTIRACNEDH